MSIEDLERVMEDCAFDSPKSIAITMEKREDDLYYCVVYVKKN